MPKRVNVSAAQLSSVNFENASKKICKKTLKKVFPLNVSSEEYKNSLYPKDYSPLVTKILTPQPDLTKQGYGLKIIDKLDCKNDDPYINKALLMSLYEPELDEYIEKIDKFEIDNNKKLLLINLLASQHYIAKQSRIPSKSEKYFNLFAYCLEDIKKIDLSQDTHKIQKLIEFQINNFYDEKCRSIIFDDKYDSLPIYLINHIGTFFNANEELDNFLSFGDALIKEIKTKFPLFNIDYSNGKFLYGFLNLLHRTNKDSKYEDLSTKDLMFCQTFLLTINTIAEDGTMTYINEMLKESRPNLSINDETESFVENNIKEKLNIINSLLYSQIHSEIPKEQEKALNNILSILDGLKKVNIESINSSTIETDETLNYIFNAVPKLRETIGKGQFNHTYTLEKHIISVAQNVVKDEEYQKLDDNNKKLLLIAALMHDVTKKEGGQDLQHPQTGAQFAYCVLENVLNEEERLTVANLIYNHHFNASLSSGKRMGDNNLISNLAYECACDRNEQFMQMLTLLGKADLLGNPCIRDKYLPTLSPNIEILNSKIELVRQTLSKMKKQLALTPFPRNTGIEDEVKQQTINELFKHKILNTYVAAGKDKPVYIIDLTQIEKVKDENKQKLYLETLGFGKNITYDKLNLLVHAISCEKQAQGIDNLMNTYKTDAILSTSNITMQNAILFNDRYCGFVFDSDNTSILEVSAQDIFSGAQKKRSQIGQFLNHSISKSDSDFVDIFDKLKTKNVHSEILATDFSVSAIFITKKQYEINGLAKNSLLSSLIELAYKHKLPVILIP